MALRTYKYRLYPNKETTSKLYWTLTRCRELYNAALSEYKDAYKKHFRQTVYQNEQGQIFIVQMEANLKINEVSYNQQQYEHPCIRTENTFGWDAPNIRKSVEASPFIRGGTSRVLVGVGPRDVRELFLMMELVGVVLHATSSIARTDKRRDNQ